MKRLFLLFCLLILAPFSVGWQFFTSIIDYTLYNSEHEVQHLHSEYIYGECHREELVLYSHAHLSSFQVLGKLIVRGWLDAPRIPVCIILRAVAYESDLFRLTGYNFQFCVPRITYCHSHMRYKYFYYEWYIPKNYAAGTDWDLYFFGAPTLEWQ